MQVFIVILLNRFLVIGYVNPGKTFEEEYLGLKFTLCSNGIFQTGSSYFRSCSFSSAPSSVFAISLLLYHYPEKYHGNIKISPPICKKLPFFLPFQKQKPLMYEDGGPEARAYFAQNCWKKPVMLFITLSKQKGKMKIKPAIL